MFASGYHPGELVEIAKRMMLRASATLISAASQLMLHPINRWTMRRGARRSTSSGRR